MRFSRRVRPDECFTSRRSHDISKGRADHDANSEVDDIALQNKGFEFTIIHNSILAEQSSLDDSD